MSAPPNRKIHGERKLEFADEAELRRYYEDKYRTGGYEEGFVVQGLNLSALYHQRRRQVALAFLEVRPEHCVLDAGCGSGTLSLPIAAAGCREVHAVDIAANALDPAVAARHPNLRFQQMNVEALTFPDATFDRVVCMETLEHLLAPERALQEFSRVLKPGGRLVLTYPTVNRTLAKTLRLSWKMPISEHLNEWSFAELRRHARARGLHCERAEGIAFDLGPLLAVKRLHPALSRSITRLSLSLRAWPANSLFVAACLRKD